ncbi:MAG: hypothetical protein WA738_09850 [Candidatus Angelobacter sp.]
MKKQLAISKTNGRSGDRRHRVIGKKALKPRPNWDGLYVTHMLFASCWPIAVTGLLVSVCHARFERAGRMIPPNLGFVQNTLGFRAFSLWPQGTIEDGGFMDNVAAHVFIGDAGSDSHDLDILNGIGNWVLLRNSIRSRAWKHYVPLDQHAIHHSSQPALGSIAGGPLPICVRPVFHAMNVIEIKSPHRNSIISRGQFPEVFKPKRVFDADRRLAPFAAWGLKGYAAFEYVLAEFNPWSVAGFPENLDLFGGITPEGYRGDGVDGENHKPSYLAVKLYCLASIFLFLCAVLLIGFG